MFKYLFEHYNVYADISNYDTRPGAGITLSPNKSLGLTSGDSRPMFPKEEEEYEDDIYIDDDTLEAVSKKLGDQKPNVIDPKRSDMPMSGMRQGPGLYEYSDHTNPIRHGISPYKQKKFSGPPIGGGSASQAFRTTGNLRRTGTLFGTSRAPVRLEDDEPVNFYDSVIDPMERAFLKQQKRIKNILKNKIKS